MQFLRHVLLAVQFFTRLPVTGRLAEWVGYSPAMLRASAAHFPAVGWLVGGVACAMFAFVSLAFPSNAFTPLAAAVACTMATALFTGGFHEDGLADVADGLGGSQDRARALDIMKDSRVGAFGAMALVLTLLAKVALLATLGAQGLAAALGALASAHVLSRFWPLLLVRTLSHVGDAGRSKSKPLADQITRTALAAALVWCLPPLALAGWLAGGWVILGASLSSAVTLGWMRRWFASRLQGFTGDCLGATQQVCELACYAGALLALGPWLAAAP